MGLHNPQYPSTLISTTLNGTPVLNSVAWMPSWPDGTASGAYSSVFTGLLPSIPGAVLDVTLTPEMARDAMSLVQLPSAVNGYTTIIEFNDDVSGSDDVYQARLTFTTAVPEPETTALALVGIGVVGVMGAGRRNRRAI